jgi:acyl phosphate:glycerol-3-phosphate acyltransferase
VTPWLGLLLSYLLGAVPSSYVAGRLVHGIDLRAHGSGNLGATNAFRVLGARTAAPVMAFDVAKGFVPVWFFPAWFGVPLATLLVWALAFGAAAIIGHVYPVYMGFRGGKGVATATGVFLALAPLAIGVAFVIWLVVLRLSRMASLASILAALTLASVLLVLPHAGPVRILGVLIALFVVFAHRANIGRMRRGEEHRFGSARTPPSGPSSEDVTL